MALSDDVDTGRTGPSLTGSPPRGEGALLDRVALAVNSSLEIDDVLERLAGLALEAVPADRCSVFLLDDSGLRLLPTTYAARPELSALLEATDGSRPHFRDMPPIDLEEDPKRWRAFRRGQAFTIPDVVTSPLVPPRVAADYGVRSAVVVPLIAPQEPLGVLALDWTKPVSEFRQDDLTLVEAIGAYATLAIRNARLYERLTLKAGSLERLVEVASQLNSSLSLQEVFELVCKGFEELLGSIHCSAYLIDDEEPDGVKTIAACGESRPGEPHQATPRAPRRAMRRWERSPEPLVYADLGDGVAFGLPLPESASCAVLFPLVGPARIRGFVQAAFETSEPPSRHAIDLGQALADLSAAATERAALYENLGRRLQQMEVLYRLSEVTGGAHDLTGALRALNDLLGPEVGIEIRSISVANKRLRSTLDAPAPTDVEMETIRSWRVLLAKDPKGVRPRVVEDAVLVPVVQRNRVQGLLGVELTGYHLDSTGEELLLAIGSACAEMIHKSGLRRDLAESEQRLAVAAERERIAQDLHDSVGQLITGLGMRLKGYAGEAPDPEWERRLEELVDVTAKGSRQIREAIHALLFFQVRKSGLVRSLRELAQAFEATSGIQTSFRVRGRASSLAPAKEDALFRVAHESLTNVQRHAEAAAVSMVLTYGADDVCLAVRDQGKGLGHDDLSQRPDHFGLPGIARLLDEVGGELLVADAHPRGVLVEARIWHRRRRAHGDSGRRGG